MLHLRRPCRPQLLSILSSRCRRRRLLLLLLLEGVEQADGRVATQLHETLSERGGRGCVARREARVGDLGATSLDHSAAVMIATIVLLLLLIGNVTE